MTIEFEVPGAPIGWQRAGRNRRTGAIYTQSKTRAKETEIAEAYRAAANGWKFGDKAPLRIQVTAYYPIPKSAAKAQREAMLDGKVRPTVKPDYDNVAKLVGDALNGVAYRDDAQIVDGRTVKMYSETPGIAVLIGEVK